MTVYGAERLRWPDEAVQAYRCQECDNITEDIEVLTAYKCPSCSKLHEYREEAIECWEVDSAY